MSESRRVRIRLAAAVAPLGIILIALTSTQSPVLAAAPPRFLTLPFNSSDKVVIQRAWWTIGSSGRFDLLHHAIDYVGGKRDVVSSWKHFDALAAAAGEACGAKLGQKGCFDSGEIMGNRVLIKHKVDGQVFYTFYNHLESIAAGIPLNSIKDTVHVDAGQQIGVVGESNSPGFIHLHFELLDANFKPLDPYGIYGITDQYPDPKGKNGRTSGKGNYFLTNPPGAFGAVANPSPSPQPSASSSPSPEPSGNPRGSSVPASVEPGASDVALGTSPAAASPTSSGSPGPSAARATVEGGLGVAPVAVGIGAIVTGAVLLSLLLLSRRRRRGLPGDRYRRP